MQTIQSSRRFLAIVALVAIGSLSARAADDRDAAAQKERELIGILNSDAPAAEKAITCKRLAIFGTKDAVPAIAPLLNDERLASWARTALEVIPGPEADKALRDAMGTLEGRTLIGVINSIGVRGDEGSVEGLAEKLNAKDAEVADAAAIALGRIGNDPASKILRQSLTSAPANLRPAVAEACILCAEQLLADGKAEQAIEIYDAVRQGDLPGQRIREATRGAILARRSEGIPLLIEQLRSSDKKAFRMGLSTAREMSGEKVTDALATEFVQATPERGALLLGILASRGETVSSPVVLQAAKTGPKQVRIAAIGVLGRLGDVACLPTLLDIATVSDAELSESATNALAELPGKEVDANLAARLTKADEKLLSLLIQLVGQRRIDATPALLKAIDHRDAQIRNAALTALGETIGQDDLSVLIARVAAPKRTEDTPAAQKALRAACIRMPDGEQCAQQLTAAMSGKPVPTQVSFLKILGAMGGANALKAIGAAAKDADPQLQDTGSRLLGEWMTVDAGPALLELAKAGPEGKYQIRALRGYIRIARQFNMPNQQRAEMCRNALDVAQRADEQKLALKVIELYPSIEMLRLASKATEAPALKDDATRVAFAVAQKLGGNSAAAQELLAGIRQDPVELEIIKAEYGASDRKMDVTEALRRHAGNMRLISLPSSNYNASFGGDPARGIRKELKIQYRINGKPGEASFAENAIIMLPMPD